MNKYMRLAVDEGFKNIRSGDGGPFGAVIVRDGEVIAQAHNKVLLTHDPTMHAEMIAIRLACERRGGLICPTAICTRPANPAQCV